MIELAFWIVVWFFAFMFGIPLALYVICSIAESMFRGGGGGSVGHSALRGEALARRDAAARREDYLVAGIVIAICVAVVCFGILMDWQ